MGLNPRTYQFLVGVFASFGSYLFGYDLGVIGGSLGADAFKHNFGFVNDNGGPKSTKWANEVGAIVSIFTGGAFFGAMFAGATGDWLGRRMTIMVGSIIFILGSALQTAATNFGFLYAGRAIAGLGIGFMVMIIPLYQAEIAHPSIRGRVTALQQFMLGLGALTATWCTYGTSRENGPIGKTNNAQWRIPLGVQVIPAVFLAALILLFPESPRWLIDHGKSEQGLQTLAKLHSNGDTSDSWVQAEYEQIIASIELEHEVAAKGYKTLLTDRSSLRRLILTTAIQASVQMTGVSAIQYFQKDIYNTVNVSGDDALIYTGISNILSLLAQAACILLIDRLGRRWALIGGNLGNCFCFILVTAAVVTFQKNAPDPAYTADSPDPNFIDTPGKANLRHQMKWLFICINWVFQITFSFGCGPLSWIIPPEIFNTKTRSKGVSIGVMTSFAFNTLIGQVTAPAILKIGWKFFLIFVICNFTNALFFWAFLPETAKRPLEEMDVLFNSKSWFVPTMRKEDFAVQDLEHRAREIEEKNPDNIEIERK